MRVHDMPKFIRDRDGFFLCPTCSAPSLSLSEISKHFTMMHVKMQSKRNKMKI